MDLKKHLLRNIIICLFILIFSIDQASSSANGTEVKYISRLPPNNQTQGRIAKTFNLSKIKEDNFSNNREQEILHRFRRQPGNRINVQWNTTYNTDGSIFTIVFFYQTIGDSYMFRIPGELPVPKDQLIQWARENADKYGKVKIPNGGEITTPSYWQPQSPQRPQQPPIVEEEWYQPPPKPTQKPRPPPPPPDEEEYYRPPPSTLQRPRPTQKPRPPPPPPPDEEEYYRPPPSTTQRPRPTQKPRPPPPTTRPPPKTPGYNSVLPSLCGTKSVDTEDKIFHGRVTRIQDSPWQVAMLDVITETFFCGGSIITERHIISAAHCFYFKQDDSWRADESIIVRVGDDDRETTDGFEVDFHVSKLYHHQHYKPHGNKRNDITIIMITNIIQFNTNVFPICIPVLDTTYRSSQGCEITGWGSTEESEGVANRYLKVAELNLVDDKVCQACHSDRNISRGMVCAGNALKGGADTCQGDSGGPLACKDSTKRRYFLYGITSWGVDCGRKHRPGVYTKVSMYYNWILNKIVRSLADEKGYVGPDEDIL